MRLISLTSHEPEFNLAAEEYVFLNFNETTVMLWQNKNAVIIGRNQNMYAEINSEAVLRDDVSVVRRITGGGAVYHDLGNVNYSVITHAMAGDALNFKKFAEPVLSVLCEMGVNAEFSGRNDLLIDGKKISGNAQHIANGKLLHHGTLLFSSDTGKLREYLTVNPDKIKSKSVSSVSSRVTNIEEHLSGNELGLSVDGFMDKLRKHFTETGFAPYSFSSAEEESINALADSKYRTWAWNCGQAPKYSFNKTTYTIAGTVEIHLDISDGIIINAAVFGDFFALKPTEDFTISLIGVHHDKDALKHLFEAVNIGEYFAGLTAEKLIECFF